MSPFLNELGDWERQLKLQIRRRYGAMAAGGAFPEGAAARAVAAGYPADWVGLMPAGLAASYSGCGFLWQGMTAGEDDLAGQQVVDLGAGAGFDGFIAGQIFHADALVSVDLTPEMGAVAGRSNPRLWPLAGDIERLPLADGCADLVIANASFNLTVNKDIAFAEAYRILKLGGRLIARDLVKVGELPAEVREDPLSFNTSLGGAGDEETMEKSLNSAGFSEVQIFGHQPFSYLTSVLISAAKLR